MFRNNILLIADEECSFVLRRVFNNAFSNERYKVHSIIDKFDTEEELRNHPLVQGRNGPLNARTIEALILREGIDAYDGILVDLRCDDNKTS